MRGTMGQAIFLAGRRNFSKTYYGQDFGMIAGGHLYFQVFTLWPLLRFVLCECIKRIESDLLPRLFLIVEVVSLVLCRVVS